MLKWVVNGCKTTYLEESEVAIKSCNAITDDGVKVSNRLSCDNCLSPCGYHGSKTQLTSTPLNSTLKCINHNKLHKMDTSVSLNTICLDENSLFGGLTKKSVDNESGSINRIHAYNSTLPTYAGEYSPCNIIPGPILALRGIAIPDAYFKKPRYMSEKYEKTEQCVLSTISYTTSNDMDMINIRSSHKYDSPLSSKMGDVTLEHMINAILASNNKTRTYRRNFNTFSCAAINSPTYTQADDPPNDLQEFINFERKIFQCNQKLNGHDNEMDLHMFNKIRTNKSLLLKRYRGVRHKCRMRKFNSNLIRSNQESLDNSFLQEKYSK